MPARYAPAVLLAVAAVGWANLARRPADDLTPIAVRQLTDPHAAHQLRTATAARDRTELLVRLVPGTCVFVGIAAGVLAARFRVKK
jgi:hypothetical protein